MDRNATLHPDVAPFRMVEFREREEFEAYCKVSEALRGDRWLYEQSLATFEDAVSVQGTCGLCLTGTVFTASTRSGEIATGGRVPNWREELVCDCRQRLSNRHRALMHYLLAAELLHGWTRTLALGDLGALLPTVRSLAQQVTCWPGAIDQLPSRKTPPERRYHLVISTEQINAASIQPGILAALASQLLDGGRLVFTTPFNATADAGGSHHLNGPIGWAALDSLREHGFTDAKACLYWSEEFGYLGPLNFIFEASK